MKRLILVRHAKSSWDNPDQDDFDRPLNKRGRTDAPIMAAEIKKRIAKPDIILSSDSVRTRETVGFILEAYEADEPSVQFQRRLYGAELWTLFEVLSQADDAYSSVMLVGHNPGLTEFHNRLSGSGWIDNIPTFGVIELELAIDHWNEITDAREARRTTVLFPKALGA